MADYEDYRKRSGAGRMSFKEHEALLAKYSDDALLDECIERLLPILTHQVQPSYMSIPVDFNRDDDAFVIERLRFIKKRLLEKGTRALPEGDS